MKTSRSCVLAVVAMGVFVAVIVGVLSLTTKNMNPTACPQCGTPYQKGDIIRGPKDTFFACRKCGHHWEGPISYDVPWADAVEHHLESSDHAPAATP